MTFSVSVVTYPLSLNTVVSCRSNRPLVSCQSENATELPLKLSPLCLNLVDELGFKKNMFLRFAVAFLEYSENLHLIRAEKKNRVPENKKHQSETV